MDFSLKLFCFVLVTIPLVTTTDSAICATSDLQACVKKMTDLTPAQMDQKTIVCKAKEDFINCETMFLQQCPSSKGDLLLKRSLDMNREIYSDVCGRDSQSFAQQCPDGFKIFKCDRFLSPQELQNKILVCETMRESQNCKASFNKKCNTFPWLTKSSLAQERKVLEKICPSGVSMTMSSLWVVLTLSAWSGLRQFL